MSNISGNETLEYVQVTHSAMELFILYYQTGVLSLKYASLKKKKNVLCLCVLRMAPNTFASRHKYKWENNYVD